MTHMNRPMTRTAWPLRHAPWAAWLLVLFLPLLLTVPVSALGQTASGLPAVIDDAGLFTDDETQDLVRRAEVMNERWDMDVVIVTTDDADGKSAMAYADDYFDYNGYGTGADRDGILFLIDMDNRMIWLSTSGDAIRRMTDARIDTVLDRAIVPMRDGDYDGTVHRFLTETDRQIGPRRFQLKHAAVGLAAGALVFWIFFASNRSRYKKKSQKWNYDLKTMAVADFPVFSTVLVDRFVTTRRRPRQSSSGGRGGGGGSSTHTSSSGRSHGGGGRSF